MNPDDPTRDRDGGTALADPPSTAARSETTATPLDPLFESLSRATEPVRQFLKPLQQVGARNIAWIGSALLIIGLFLPVKTWSVTVLGYTASKSDNYWELTVFVSIILLLLAAISAAAAYYRDYRWLWVTGVITLVFLIFGFIDAITTSYAHPSWGWILLIPGVLLVLAAAIMGTDPAEERGDALAALRNMQGRATTKS